MVRGSLTWGSRAHALKPRVLHQSSNCLLAGAGGNGGGIRLRGGGGGGGGGDGNGGDDQAFIARYWSKYLELLETKPFVTRMVTGFVIAFTGDVMSQTIQGIEILKMDLKRLILFSCWGGFGFTPIAYQWYNLIERTIPATIAGRAFWKMGMDQVLFPPAITAIFFLTLTVVEGLFTGIEFTLDKGLRVSGKAVPAITDLFDTGVNKVKQDLVPTLITNYKVWPLVQVLNFAVVPLKLQVLFVNTVAVWWNFVLSITQHN